MLILTRRVGETIMIGDDVSVIVLSVHGGQIKLGINAPREVGVHREEIYQRIQAENHHAGRNNSSNTKSSSNYKTDDDSIGNRR